MNDTDRCIHGVRSCQAMAETYGKQAIRQVRLGRSGMAGEIARLAGSCALSAQLWWWMHGQLMNGDATEKSPPAPKEE